MKFLVSVLLICAIGVNAKRHRHDVIAANWQQPIIEHMDACINETKADRTLAERYLTHGNYVDDYSLKCYVYCISKGLGIVDKNGKAIPEEYTRRCLLHDDPEVLARSKLQQCYSINIPDDKCEAAYRLSQCVYLSVGKAVSEVIIESELENL